MQLSYANNNITILQVNFLKQYVLSPIPNQHTGRTYYPSTETTEINPAFQTTRLTLQHQKDKQQNKTYS